jgi:hypothetical protein
VTLTGNEIGGGHKVLSKNPWIVTDLRSSPIGGGAGQAVQSDSLRSV